jgi:hypothetical protein
MDRYHKKGLKDMLVLELGSVPLVTVSVQVLVLVLVTQVLEKVNNFVVL